MLILGQMIVFFLMIFAGALARRYKIIIPNNQEQFSSLIVNIACPCLIISAAMRAEEHMGLEQFQGWFLRISLQQEERC